jgi:glucokinase
MIPRQRQTAHGGVTVAGERIVLCYDIGGTHLRGAVYDEASGILTGPRIRATHSHLSQPDATAAEIFSQVIHQCADLGEELLAGRQPHSIVVGYPGPVTDKGVALRSPTILGHDLDGPVDVDAALHKVWPDAAIHVVNDLTCCGFFFVAKGYQDFCVITVGSGIGNKIFINGEPVIGPNGRGGEIGHLKACQSNSLPFPYQWTEVGEASSGRGTASLAKAWAYARPQDFDESSLQVGDFQSPSNDTCKLIAQSFRKGDELASRIIATACHPLAFGIASIHQAIGTETFLIVGGFAKALGERYRKHLVRTVSGMAWNLDQDWNNMIQLGETHEEEGLLGGVQYALLHLPAEQHQK